MKEEQTELNVFDKALDLFLFCVAAAGMLGVIGIGVVFAIKKYFL